MRSWASVLTSLSQIPLDLQHPAMSLSTIQGFCLRSNFLIPRHTHVQSYFLGLCSGQFWPGGNFILCHPGQCPGLKPSLPLSSSGLSAAPHMPQRSPFVTHSPAPEVLVQPQFLKSSHFLKQGIFGKFIISSLRSRGCTHSSKSEDVFNTKLHFYFEKAAMDPR